MAKGKNFKISREDLNTKIEEYLAKGKTITKLEYVPPGSNTISVNRESKEAMTTGDLPIFGGDDNSGSAHLGSP